MTEQDTTTETETETRQRRVLTGTVVSDKMDKTIVVQVQRRFKHPRYRKYVSERLRYKAHDETNQAKVGDVVRIVSCRPLSREKRWALQAIVEKATLV
jgi:small subunit ribosomal protein S17